MLLCFAVIVSAANAQVVTSSSNKTVVKYQEPKQKKVSNWYIKAGLGINEVYEDTWAETVYKFDVGFRKPFVEIYNERISFKPYRGMDFGLGHRFFTRDADYYHNYSGHNIQWSPNVGIDIGLFRYFSFDLHLGTYLGFDYSANEVYYEGSIHDNDEDDRRSFGDRFDVGINFGIGFWINRVNLEFAWQKGFISSSICNLFDSERKTNIFLLKLGYKLPNFKGSGLKVRKAE